MILVQGWDISVNHGACVELLNGNLNNFYYYTDNASSAAKSKQHAIRVPKFTGDKQTIHMHRLEFISNIFYEWASSADDDLYIGIEDYAMGAKGAGIYSIGEAGGQARMACWENNSRFRLLDPLSIKLFTTGKGNATKEEMAKSVYNKYNIEFDNFSSATNKISSEDLIDAFAIAKIIDIEIKIRNGTLNLSTLKENEIQIFNRVTKAYPENILSRGWINK